MGKSLIIGMPLIFLKKEEKEKRKGIKSFNSWGVKLDKFRLELNLSFSQQRAINH